MDAEIPLSERATDKRGKQALFSDRTGVGHIRMVGHEKTEI